MSIHIGDLVKIISLEQYAKIDPSHVAPSGIPSWANEQMLEIFGQDTIYEVARSGYANTMFELYGSNYYWKDIALEVVTKAEDRVYPHYSIDSKVILRSDISSCPYREEYKGSVVTIVENMGDNKGYYVSTNSYNTIYVPTFFIQGEWYEGYVEPDMEIKTCCDRCGNTFKYYKSKLIEADRYLCEKCRKRNFITPYHRWEPPKTFFALNEDDAASEKFLGIELEIGEGGERDDKAAHAIEIMNNKYPGQFFIYASHDSSIHHGFELITAPATFATHKENYEKYKEMFDYLVNAGYRGHDTQNCGIHIHFSRKYFEHNEEENIAKLLYLVEKFWDEIVMFSRRNYNTLDRYAKKTDDNTTAFIKKWNKNHDDHNGHYYAVNISNKDTIELRMFRSTLNIYTFFATLEFANNLITIAKEKNISELHTYKFEDLLTPLALEYYENRKNKFEELTPKVITNDEVNDDEDEEYMY